LTDAKTRSTIMIINLSIIDGNKNITRLRNVYVP
jgi:hypothetical protein